MTFFDAKFTFSLFFSSILCLSLSLCLYLFHSVSISLFLMCGRFFFMSITFSFYLLHIFRFLYVYLSVCLSVFPNDWCVLGEKVIYSWRVINRLKVILCPKKNKLIINPFLPQGPQDPAGGKLYKYIWMELKLDQNMFKKFNCLRLKGIQLNRFSDQHS